MKNNPEKLLRSFLSFDYSKRTIDMFHHWMIGADSTKEKETAFRNLWSKTKGKSAKEDTDRSFLQVLDKIGVEYSPMMINANRWNVWKSVAAAAVLVILSVTATLWGSYKYFDKDNVVMVEHYVKNGVRDRICLPDGTMMYLNSGSHVFYPENLEGKTRTVYLVGEAGFKVTKNPAKPFIVRSANLKITALGTEFNVRAYPEEDEITASLLEGKIRVDCNDTASYVLNPGHQVVYDKCTTDSRMQTVNMKDVMAWQRGEIVFDKATLTEIVRTLERHYGIMFHISTKKPNKDRYNFVFKEDTSIEEVLEVMQVIIGQFDYRLKDNVCHIVW